MIGAFSADLNNGYNQGAAYVFRSRIASIDDWRAEKSSPDILNNPTLELGVWGDLADPDGDRLSNLAEAYFGLDPMSIDGSPMTVAVDHGHIFHRWPQAEGSSPLLAARLSNLVSQWRRSGRR